MSTRISDGLPLALLALGACGASSAAPDIATGTEHIDCALHGAAGFAPACALERVSGEGGLELVVRHPDGGFRRFAVVKDGHGLATADGAEPARIAVIADGIEVTVGSDRYRFPATIARHDER